MSQPTLFDPLFKEVIKLGQESMKKGGLDYVVIVVMTDGEIHDMKSVIDTVIQASRLPISIIIIGIGQASFAKMQCLDGNQGLVNSKGEKWERDMVSFLEFKKQISDFVSFSKQVLSSLPSQIAEFYSINKGNGIKFKTDLKI